MKLYMKKILVCSLSLLALNSFPLFATDLTTTVTATKSILTVDEAISAALGHNSDLSLNAKQDKVYEEQLKYASDLSTLSYQTLYLSQQQNTQNKSFLEDKISYDISTRYTALVLGEQELLNLDLDIEMKQRELAILAAKQKLGLTTQLQYDAKALELSTLQTSKQTKQETLASNKANFKIITGLNPDDYTLETNFELDELETGNNSQGFIKSTVGTYLSYSKQLAEIKLNHVSDSFTTAGPTTAEYAEAKYNAQQIVSSVSDQEDNLIETLTSKYANLVNIQEQIHALEPQATLLTKQIETAKIQLQVGLITQLEYDQTAYQLKDTDYSLKSLINNYNSLKQQIEKPWVS